MFSLGTIAIFVAWRRTLESKVEKPARTPAITRSIFLWSSIAVANALWELASYILGEVTKRDDATPTITMLVAHFIAHPIGKLFFVALWLFAGYSILTKPSLVFSMNRYMDRRSNKTTSELEMDRKKSETSSDQAVNRAGEYK